MHTLAYLPASLLWLLAATLPTAVADSPKPNFVLIMADDMGYGDPGCYGSKVHRTPNLDRLATEGTRFTDFYAAANVCTPTRAALMTGTYHRRNQMHFGVNNPWGVLTPVSPKGLHPDEITVAELLKQQGYATACIGKWHLGDQPEYLPTSQGFDFYFGIPYSNDMGQRKGKPWPPLPLMRDTQVIDAPVDQSTLTPRYTEQALAFIEKHRDEPFFLYLPHTFPHVPLHANDRFRGKSKNGCYGDAVEEIDWSTGQILGKLASLDLDDNTLVIFTSDNGAEVRQAGSNEPLRGWKGSVWEGGHRVPCLMRWPGRVPAGRVCRELVTCMDVLPTLTLLAGAQPPGDRTIDGYDIRPLLFGKPGAESPYQAFYYLARHRGSIEAVRSGPWKLHVKPRQLYNLHDDIGEQNNVAAEHTDIVARLRALAEEQEQDFQRDQRPAGHVDDPQPVTAPKPLPIARLVAGDCALAAEKPNVLFIAIDDMNDWTTLFDRNHPIKTPHLERLAARGTFFTRGYCAVPACNPSRTCNMTGYSPQTSRCFTNGDFQFWKRGADVVTLPQYFRNHGYGAKGAGKIFHHGPSCRGDDPRGTEFSWDDFQKHIVARKEGPNYNGYRRGMPGIAALARVYFDWGEHEQKMVDYDTVEYAEKAMAETWDKPMFLAAGIFKPHLPFYAPPEVFERYPLDATKLPPMPENDLDDVPEIGKRLAHQEFFIYNNTRRHEPPDPRSIERMVQCYQASADFADSMVGRLLDALDKSGRAENTIIVLWADHGYHLGDKESCVKFTLWEKANHVPFIIVAPGVTKPGSVCDEPVTLLNIYPTLVELCGLPPKPDNDGHSLVPLLKNPDADWPHPAIMTQGKGNNALRTDRWRYIRYRDGSEELYDHQSDPWEWKNLAGDEAYGDVIAGLRAKLDAAVTKK